MRSHIIATIFKKEMKEVLRDKRMLYLIILMPFFLYPVLFTLIGSIGASQQEKLTTEKVTVWLSHTAEGTPIQALLIQDSSLRVMTKAFVQEDLDSLKKTMGILVPADYEQRLAAGQSAEVTILADQSQDVLDLRAGILARQLAAVSDQVLSKRLTDQGLSPGFATPIVVNNVDLSPQDTGSRIMASFLPMMILLFIFIGCIYIAIDITAGEKERRTLQTLFTTPSATGEIIAGKFLAVAAVGIVSATMNILSLVVAMNIQVYLLGGSNSSFSLQLAPVAWVWLVILVLLATLFLGALSLAVVLLANSYKEAQSYVSPLMMIVLVPALMASMPGIELNYQTALVPVFNVALSIVALLKGNFDPALLGVVAAASLVYGILALYLASLTFGNENVITGEKVNFKMLFKR